MFHVTAYVQLSCNGELWLISRRFSDFDQLHSRLTRRFGDLIEVGLPEKQWFGRYCSSTIVVLLLALSIEKGTREGIR